MDTRTFPFTIKSISDAGTIEGVVSAFGEVDSYGDMIQRGAYARSLARIAATGRKLPLLYQHDTRRPIGVWTDLAETQSALIGKAELAMEVRDAQEAHALARKGALTGISIGFNVAPGGSRQDGNRRVLTDIDLFEASLVTFPADDKARLTGIKSIAGAADIADLLRQAGVSGRKAKVAAGAAWRAINESHDDPAAEAALASAIARLSKL